MSVPFSGSRLANLRQKRTSQMQKTSPTKQIEQPLLLLQQQDNSYQPSSMGFNGGRTATRFLKGRIQKPNQNQKRSSTNLGNQFNLPNKQNNQQTNKFTPSYYNQNNNDNGQFKLILNDSPVFDKKKLQTNIQLQQPEKKRILIQKKQSIEQSKVQVPVRQQPKVVKQPVNRIQQQVIQVKRQKQEEGGTIRQQDVQQSNVMENQNQLVQCPEGCGRKFNRKALEKHAKACKLVFMSKRKQFNSEAKRLTSTQQANLVKQNKLQQKKAQLGKTKGKGFDKMQKTGDNWKNASQDFRSAIKAIKKQGTAQQQGQFKVMPCQFCQKPFAQMLLVKHLQNCLKKKQKQQKQKKKAQRKK